MTCTYWCDMACRKCW